MKKIIQSCGCSVVVVIVIVVIVVVVVVVADDVADDVVVVVVVVVPSVTHRANIISCRWYFSTEHMPHLNNNISIFNSFVTMCPFHGTTPLLLTFSHSLALSLIH